MICQLKLLGYILLMGAAVLLIGIVVAGCFWIEIHGRDRYSDIVWLPAITAIAFLIFILDRCIDHACDLAFGLPEIDPAKPLVRPRPPVAGR